MALLLVLMLAPAAALLSAPPVRRTQSILRAHWDVFGRVPHDDFLFRTGALVGPDLLKRTFTETIVDELPFVLDNFRRKKRIGELFLAVRGSLGFAVAALVLTFLFKYVFGTIRDRIARDDARRGITFSTSAITKKATRKGRKIEGMDDGYLDMDHNEDDDEPEEPDDGK